MKLSLIGKEPEAGDAMSFVWQPEAPIVWQAGQFLHYSLPHENPDERGIERWFTISSAPSRVNPTITTRIGENASSFKKALLALPVGGTIEAGSPDGDFIAEEPGAEMIFIAGGIGITPYHAILSDMDNRGAEINAKLLYANRDDNFVFKSELDALAAKHKNFKIRYFVSPEKIDGAVIAQEAADVTKPTFYVSGPEPMVESFEKMLGGLGVPEPHLKRDYFPGYAWN